MSSRQPQTGSISASGTATLTCDGQYDADKHCITIQGSGVVSISLKHLDQTTYTSYATGVTANTDTYLMKGCTGVKIVENGTNSVTYSYIAYE